MVKGGASSPFEFCGIPLGGLGTGSVEIRGDGHFHQWQIMNNEPWGNGPATAEMDDEGLFFGIAAASKGQSKVMILAKGRWGDSSPGFSWEDLRWMLDPYHMPWNNFPETIDYDGRFPFANLDYRNRNFPVRAALEAFSPFIPLDSKNSGLPVAFLTFTLANTSKATQRVSLFGALKNCVGYDCPQNESVITHHETGKVSHLEFSRRDLPRLCQSDGTMALGVWSAKAGRVTYVLHAVHPRDLYDPVMETGCLENLDRSVFRGSVGNDLGYARVRKADVGFSRGLLCKTVSMKPGETVEITFALAWHFPNLLQPVRWREPATEKIGHYYENWFSSASEVVTYGARNFSDLRARSREFVDAFYGSTVDRWLLDLANAQLTSFSKSTWWDKSGRFAVWEGLGCCGLQTLDITLYGSFPIILFFPDQQKSQMELVSVTAQECGRPPHLFHGSLCAKGAPRNNRIDNSIQFILLVWRDAVWTGDRDYVRKMWPAVEIYLKDMWSMDTDGDGLPNNAGVDQSYDQFPLFGTSAYVGFQYAGALLAASELAGMIGLAARAEELSAKVRPALETLEKQLWNGAYYNLSYDSKPGTGNAGCMADQLCGDWFVRQTTGRGLVDDAKAARALECVFRYCMRDDSFLANCDWPKGGRVKIRRETSDQANCPWTGVEHAVAAEMMLLGLWRQAREILRGVYERYDRFGMRYNHIECGSHYYRAMSAWAPYLALTGFAWNASTGQITLGVPKGKGRFLWNTPSAWGYVTFGGAKRSCQLDVVRGTLDLQSLRLAGSKARSVSAKRDGRAVSAICKAQAGATVVQFQTRVSLGRGSSLTLSA